MPLPTVLLYQCNHPCSYCRGPLVVGTININGVQQKQANLRLLLKQNHFDMMELQETLLRASQLRVPGYHCFTEMGDLMASQRGVAILVSTKFNCIPVGKATPFLDVCMCLWGNPFEPHYRGHHLRRMSPWPQPSASGFALEGLHL